MEGGVGYKHLHVGVGHPALKDILKAGDSIQSLASDVQHRKQKETAGNNCREGLLRTGRKRMGG